MASFASGMFAPKMGAPRTCLLVTTMNRGALLRKSLAELAEGHRALPDEILVVDDGGNDDTEQVCAAAADRLPVRYLFHNHPGKTLCSQARNVGLKNTQAEVIITCEPECYFVSDVIAQMRDYHSRFPADVINAGTVHRLSESGARQTVTGWIATHCALYERDWLIAIGGWDESFPDPWGWDDTDLVTRLSVTGHGQQNPPEIEVVHQFHPSTAVNQDANSAHFFAKGLDQSAEKAIANGGIEWGKLRP